MADSPSDIAVYMAYCSRDLNSLTRTPCVSDDPLYEQMLGFNVKGFLEAFELCVRYVVPVLDTFKRAEPVRHSGSSGASYHALVCAIAWRQYKDIWAIYSPQTLLDFLKTPRESIFDGIAGDEFYSEDVIRLWPRISENLAHSFADVEPIDADFLAAGIATDPSADLRRPGACRIKVVRSLQQDTVELDGVPINVTPDWADAFEALIHADGGKVGITKAGDNGFVRKPKEQIVGGKLHPRLCDAIANDGDNKGYYLKPDYRAQR